MDAPCIPLIDGLPGDESTPVRIHEVEDRLRYLAELDVASSQLVGNVHRHIAGPAFGGVEGDDADGLTVLAVDQLADQRIPVSSFRVGLSPGAPDAAEIIQHKVSVLIGPMGHNGWRGTHDQTPRPAPSTTDAWS